MQKPIELSPSFLSRTGGLLYLAVILLGMSQQIFVRGKLFVAGDATATAENLRSMEWLWRAGLLMEIVMLFATIALVWALHSLLRPVSKELALLALLFCLGAIGESLGFYRALDESGGAQLATVMSKTLIQRACPRVARAIDTTCRRLRVPAHRLVA